MSTHNPMLGRQRNEPAFHSKFLKDDHDIQTAQRLIYQVFVNEMEWIPDRDNPSGIQFINTPTGTRFVDRFDQTALWYGTCMTRNLLPAGDSANRWTANLNWNTTTRFQIFSGLPKAWKSLVWSFIPSHPVCCLQRSLLLSRRFDRPS